MKKFRSTPVLAAALALAVGGAALSGCVAPQQSGNEEVLAKLDQMQSQIDELKADQESAEQDASRDDSSDLTGADSDASSATDTASASNVDEFGAKLDDLASRADEAAATAAKASVPSNAADRPKAYFDAKAPLEKLGQELDSLDDAIEAAYRQGSLSKEDVWSLEKKEDAIDAVLDRAEDDLEMRMGVDD